jgi:hypothetical protein
MWWLSLWHWYLNSIVADHKVFNLTSFIIPEKQVSRHTVFEGMTGICLLVLLHARFIEIGLEQALFFDLFFSAFEHVRSLLIMGPNNTKNSSLKCDFHIINTEKYCQNLVLIVKKHQIWSKTVSLLCVKTKSMAHKQLTFYFQMWKYFCRHLHPSLISMARFSTF